MVGELQAALEDDVLDAPDDHVDFEPDDDDLYQFVDERCTLSACVCTLDTS